MERGQVIDDGNNRAGPDRSPGVGQRSPAGWMCRGGDNMKKYGAQLLTWQTY